MVDSIFEFSNTNVMVEFRIVGDDFDVNYITEALSVVPSKCWRKGDKVENRNIIRKYSCWEFDIGYEESFDINTQLNKIITIFSPLKDQLIMLKKMLDIDYVIEIVINVENDIKPAMFLNHKVIEFAYLIGAQMDFDMYIF